MPEVFMRISTEFNYGMFDEIENIWKATGIYSSERGDDYKQVIKTIESNGKILTAYKNNEIVGTCWLTCDSRRLYLHHLAVLPEYQNQGIGKELLKKSIEIGEMMQLQIKLEVFEESPAVKLYESFGFKTIENYNIMIKRR
jgi:ribosomal protein S18 acetylase RimI-like enzyme